MNKQWFKVHSWHIVRSTNQGKGESVMVTAICGLKKYSTVALETSADFPSGEKTCEGCLRTWAKGEQ